MADNISKISDDFKELVELKIQNQAQFNVIVNLGKTNKDLQKEIEHLKGMLDKTVPIISPISSLSPVPESDGDSEATICKIEIEKLRNKSTIEALTFEDAKKLEIYTKILSNLRNKPKTIEIMAKRYTNDELLLSLEENTHKDLKGE